MSVKHGSGEAGGGGEGLPSTVQLMAVTCNLYVCMCQGSFEKTVMRAMDARLRDSALLRVQLCGV